MLIVIMLAALTTGCGTLYHLPGHNERNWHHPPPVTLTVGERRLAVSTGITLFVMGPVQMSSSDTNIVSVALSDKQHTAYLIAHRVGTATVTYGSYPGKGSFEVRVIEKKSRRYP